jgi:GntR family transcriptional regulator
MSRPMYAQIAEDLRRQIESGQLPQGAQLPTELELSAQYAASRNTVREAIKRLAALHVVESRPGQGTFVTPTIEPIVVSIGRMQSGVGPADLAGMQHRSAVASLPTVEFRSGDQLLTDELSLPDHAQVVSRHHVLHIDEVPWCLQTSFYPMELVTRGATRLLLAADDLPEGSLVYLSQSLAVVARTWRAKMLARSPDDNEARLFGLSGREGVAIVEIRHIYYAEDTHEPGLPFCVTVSAYPADRNQFTLSAGEVPGLAI